MKILTDIPINFTPAQITEALHLQRKDSSEKIKNLIETAQPLITARAIYEISYVDAKFDNAVTIEGIRFTSHILRKNLDQVERVFPYVLTIGSGIEEKASASDDLLERYYLDTIGDIALGIGLRYLENEIQSKYAMGKISRMNPGSLADWPIEEQRPLFSLLGSVASSIGVRLTKSLLMLPRKSVSGIYFPTEISFESCQLCPRERCPSRKTPYSERRAKEYGIVK